MKNKGHMEKIKEHFESEAVQFDEIICRLIPYYDEMLEALALNLPFSNNRNIKVIDVGCGTGTISSLVAKKYPKAEIITCLDITKNMLEMAKDKLKGHKNVRYIQADLNDYEFDMKYDAVISSLTVHHLKDDANKIKFYKKVYNALNKGGIFINADIVLGATDLFQIISIKKWKEYMNRTISEEEIENKWLVKYREEDYPARLLDQIGWLKEIRFKDIEIFWKYYNFAVFGGLKYG